MKILFEDKDIIVCIKPVGILSQADSGGGDSMISRLSSYTGNVVYPLHRLDKEVGGVMVFAKTKKAASVLSRAIANKNFKKEYIACVHGEPTETKGEMRDLLFKDTRKNKSFVVKRERKGVKEALLEYEVIKTFKREDESYSVVKILLHTGRTHQIRVQFASRKMPLAGDKKYGAKDVFKNIALWSFCIGFNHPESGETMKFSAEPEILKEFVP